MNRRDLLAHASAVALTGSLARAQPLPVFSDTVPPRLGSGPLSSAGAPSLNLDFVSTPGTLSPLVTLTRGSTATYFDATGTMQTVSGNTPRWDYNPSTHAPNGLLIEEIRANLLLNSATLGTQGVAVTAQAYTLSFYGTGTITKSGAASGALVGTGAFPQRVSQTFTPSAGTLTCTVTGSVLNAQLEAGGFVTSWIPTTGAAVTRNADQCVIPPANMGFFVSPGGSWMAEYIYQTPSPSNTRVIGYAAGGSGPTSIYLLTTGATGQYDQSAGMNTANSAVLGAVSKSATTYAPGTGRACVNAGAIASAAMPTGYGLLATGGIFFMGNGLTSETTTGYIRRVRYWPRVLSNFEMQSVTT